MGDSIQQIGVEAFRGCINLQTINIPDSVNKIGKNAFKNCNNISLTVCKSSGITMASNDEMNSWGIYNIESKIILITCNEYDNRKPRLGPQVRRQYNLNKLIPNKSENKFVFDLNRRTIVSKKKKSRRPAKK